MNPEGNIKLLIDARMLMSSGIGVYLQELLDYLKNLRGIHCLINDKDVFFFKERAIPFTSFNENIYSISEQLKYPFKIPKADVFWSPHYNTPLLPIKCDRRIVTIHDVYHLATASQAGIKQKVYANLLMYNSTKRSEKIITVSEFSKQEIVKYTGCNPDKISVIHNGVCQVKNERLLLDEKYNLPKKYLLFVGNVKPHKNLITLCLAYLQLPAKLQSDFKIVIVGKKEGFINGDNDLINLIKNEPKLYENVVFTGYVDAEDMDAIYKKASIFVFPSLYEGFGLPPLEAMGNGTPVICSDIPPLKEVCGNAVLYFDAKDPKDLADKIIRMNDQNIASNYIELGIKRASKFTWRASYDKHLEVFNL